nr:GGDEF domain-containing protein [Treponemataceae bacterium]
LTEGYYIFVFLKYRYFLTRTLESLFLVFVYLMIAAIYIMVIVKRLINSRELNLQHIQVFQSMSEIYYSLHLVDLKTGKVIEYSGKNQVKESFDRLKGQKAEVMMKEIMHATMSDEYLERGLEFTDLSTIAERMKDKKIISRELLGKNVGWIRMSFITISAENGYPKQIIVATQIIDEEKKMTESLLVKSHTDELTKCLNRRAYNDDILNYLERPDAKDFVYMSLDVNGLKTVNDDLGHEAGDELLLGAVECMNSVFSNYGRIYRIGGDEFVALLFIDGNLMKGLCEAFDKKLGEWHGEQVKSISISYGYVISDEAKGMSMIEIAGLADKKMYEAKKKYYSQAGISRRRT